MRKRLTFLLLVLLPIAGCEVTGSSVRMLVADYRQFDAEAVRAIFEEQSRLSFVGVAAPPGVSAIDALNWRSLPEKVALEILDVNSCWAVPGWGGALGCRSSQSSAITELQRACLPGSSLLQREVVISSAFCRTYFAPAAISTFALSVQPLNSAIWRKVVPPGS